MKLRVLIPVCPFEQGKRRLASRLSAPQRQALNARFLRHVLDVVREAVPAIDCIVVSRSPEVLDIARRAGMRGLRENAPGGLNEALEQAAALAHAQGADAVLSISCDLPLLQSTDVRALIACAAPGKVVLGTDRDGEGTNALLVSPAQAIPYCYGPGSHHAHRAAARGAGLAFESILRPGIATDVDTPADLETLALEIPQRFPAALEVTIEEW